ncbi:class I SAM-dependent methyltransferase [Bradyrhizobium barranii subsp. apii]|uniref:Class I SAM-dependent methyltransferase n=1 Tax=Bradyrhizobium barranii subsp. apii TaxID=2819348 RepID=A0A8T5VIL0_9BRAD|nr:class I SAM-dependent methyltransferase [Bradyrhizobium barranii]UPT88636.1 class I SAM-dependent methyltransferase [Bradyrhizobium barranii subsp. apii]
MKSVGNGFRPSGGEIKSFAEYMENGFPNVEGWVHHGHGSMLSMIAEMQDGAEITGHVGEIGVYHGKLLIALAHLTAAGSKVTALDVYDDQAKNLDGAGVGSLARLRENIDRFGPPDRDYAFLQADSLALTSSDIVTLMRERGPFRMFSVDGCHTAEHTYNDLMTAQNLICPGGVIILDDFMQPHWPGVTEAVNLMFSRTVPRVWPFLYCFHKLYFVGAGWHAPFLTEVQRRFGNLPEARPVAMFGHTALALY